MADIQLGENYWDSRYQEGQTQWDTGAITTPLKAYFDQLTDKSVSILIPGCGNAYEAEYLHQQGFENVFLADVSDIPLQNFFKRCPGFPRGHLLHKDFFDITLRFDFIIEQTFFCALHPSQRSAYAKKSAELLNKGGHLAGVLFNDSLFHTHPPYGGEKDEYIIYFKPYFHFRVFDACYNSIKPREGRELFINLVRK
ncbi:TPMT family class I SAM-dependent methyltransferase [Fulvivirga ulvae]|uniref:TPMT family class I SAM-dependent methyltransferase n=1 Tax=Fulvivirga ulvae TaxID=2904245 RepID=UPI001F201428|nr:TPMT family class I SAM-dependent methyltransferase [Fulvivirga ulvae]UII32088.1 TPMT family class I SAM-dependent methyltransferase [Fulvivirga ulvae]